MFIGKQKSRKILLHPCWEGIMGRNTGREMSSPAVKYLTGMRVLPHHSLCGDVTE